MRIIRPEEFQQLRRKPRRSGKWLLAGLAVVLVVGGYFASRGPRLKSADHARAGVSDAQVLAAQQPQKLDRLKQFTNEQFKALAQSIKYPNTQSFGEPPFITGDPEADERIRVMAQASGYHLTSTPAGSIQKIDEPRLESDNLLQTQAALAWQDLKAAAAKDTIPLALLSAYRSPEYQRNLFMRRLTAGGVTVAQVGTGQADAAVSSVLESTAAPGYSRHHTGYTIDLWCEDSSGSFLASRCYQWISANNYEKAKQVGWIPSYPDGVQGQGPEPEPWEYVWVGKENLTE